MGSCISVQKGSESALKLQLSIDPRKDQVLITSPVKEKTDLVNAGDLRAGDASIKSRLSPARFVDAGGKDESFFDSQPWLESDCDDDFLSVNGDFTPSRGNTPVHHNFSSGNPRVSNARPAEGLVVSKPEPSPSPSPSPDKKKRLSELFKESLRNNNYADNQKEAPAKVIPEPIVNQPNGTTYLSGANSMTSGEATPSREELREEDGPLKTGHCCFPRMVLSRSFSERKTKMSPAQKVG